MPIEELIDGFASFCGRFFEEGQGALYADLVENGQHPRAAVVACADSRVSPNALLQARPGDLFVIRNVGNLVQPPEAVAGNSTIAGLEFAVVGLGVQHVIVIGHSHCGGIRALIEGPSVTERDFPHVASWVSAFGTVRRETQARCPGASGEAVARAVEKAAIRRSLSHLGAYPWIRDRVRTGSLQLHGWYFDLVSGSLSGFDEAKGDYVVLVEARASVPSSRRSREGRR